MKIVPTRCLLLTILVVSLSVDGSMAQSLGKMKPVRSAPHRQISTFLPPSSVRSSDNSSAEEILRVAPAASQPVGTAGAGEPTASLNTSGTAPGRIVTPNGLNEYGSLLNQNCVLGGLGATTRYVAIGSASAFSLSTQGTIEMWVNPDSGKRTQQFIGKGATSLQFLFGMNSLSRLYFRVAGRAVNNSDGDSIVAGQWTHVAVTWANGNPFTVTFYVNGAQSGTPVSLGTAWVDNTDSVKIGGPSGGYTGEFFSGSIDEVRMWSKARAVDEIRDNRFVGLGDAPYANPHAYANVANALTGSSAYSSLISSWTFNSNIGGLAYDDIGGLNGKYMGGANNVQDDLGVPMPYNMVLYLPGNDSAFAKVPYNSAFDQTVQGTCEMWVYPTGYKNVPMILSKGATQNVGFAWMFSQDSTQTFRIGTMVYYDTAKVIPFRWSHIAVTWSGGPSFTVKFYVNGKLKSTRSGSATWNTGTDPIYIGGSQYWTMEYYRGYLDEVRVWNTERTAASIRQYMFVSGKDPNPPAGLIGLWNFDGNLKNFTSTSGIDATFNTGKTNTARLSGYADETDEGAFDDIYPRSHCTVINPYSLYQYHDDYHFPRAYTLDVPFVAIPDNDTVGVSRTLTISAPTGPVTSVQAFLAIDHSYMSDLTVSLKAPNGQTRLLTVMEGDKFANCLSLFTDGLPRNPSTWAYKPPWGFLAPAEPFGTFGGSTVQGTWTLRIVDNSHLDIGILKGWGLRFNNSVTAVDEPVGAIPATYALGQNYPNPFNPSTMIRYELPAASSVKLTVYDLLGREVSVLVDGAQDAGVHEARFDGRQLSSGVYFYRMEAKDLTGSAGFVGTHKLLLVR